jgi:hypothetical protein
MLQLFINLQQVQASFQVCRTISDQHLRHFWHQIYSVFYLTCGVPIGLADRLLSGIACGLEVLGEIF